MYHIDRLTNKIRVVSHEMKDRDSVALGFWTGVGGRYENIKNKGAAHFLEHIVFKGTQHYGCTEIKEKIEGVGGSLNAFTSEECTCYFAKVPMKKIEQTFDILSDLVLYPRISEKDVNKERGVILEEIKMYYDLPQHLVQDRLDQILWPDHPLGQNIAGSLESVGQMSFEDLRSFHREYYIASNIVVSACGAVGHKKIMDLTKKKFARSFKDNAISCLPVGEANKQPQIRVERKTIEQMHVALGVHGPSRKDHDRYALAVLNVILGGNMSSRLFNEVREKRGLAYSIASGSKLFQDTGAFVVRAGVDNTKIVDAVDVILKELKKIAKKPVSVSELTRAKDYVLGQMALNLEDTADHMFWIGESVISENKIETLSSVVKKIKRVTADDVLALAKRIFSPKGFHLSLVGPIGDDQQKKIKDLLKVS